jgi:inosose dehydratase
MTTGDTTMTLSRRQAILSAAAAAGATWFDVPRILADTVAESQRKYGGFPMGIQSYSLRGFGLDGAIEKIHQLELHYVEFFSAHFPMTGDAGKISAMTQKLKSYDITCNCYGVEGFGADHNANELKFKFCKAAGIRNISADFGPEAHESLTKLVRQYDIRIAGHNHGPGHRWDKVTDILKQIDGLDPRIGACADLGHYIRSGEDPAQVIRALKGRLYGVHLKDFKEPRKDAKGCILGEGVMDVEAVFSAMREVKFPADGALSLEYEEKPQDPIEDIRKCLAVAAAAAQKVARS